MNETIIKELHKKLLTAWNNQDASEMASLFTDNGHVVGFDGSENNGKAQIEKAMSKIFKDHQTPVMCGRYGKYVFYPGRPLY
jgi:uncharacterized protein (TIGR02246 family)